MLSSAASLSFSLSVSIGQLAILDSDPSSLTTTGPMASIAMDSPLLMSSLGTLASSPLGAGSLRRLAQPAMSEFRRVSSVRCGSMGMGGDGERWELTRATSAWSASRGWNVSVSTVVW